MIRVGFANDVEGASIARFLNRTTGAIYGQRDRMKAAGTLDQDMPLPFVTEELVRAMRAMRAGRHE